MKLRKTAYLVAIAMMSILPSLENIAQAAQHKPAASATTSTMSEGEVKKINKDTGKITIKHGPLANLDMPPMTMVFHVSDASFLDKVKVGEQVQFVAEKIGGQYIVTKIEPKP